LEDRINFALHVALFLAVNSGLWFFQLMLHPWERVSVVTGLWLAGLVGHGLYVFKLADYSVMPDYYPEIIEPSEDSPPEATSAPESPNPNS
jgi:hypothetical protein